MKWRLLSVGLLLGLVLVAMLLGCRGGAGEQDDVFVNLAVTPGPPRVGQALVVVTLSDIEGRPISGAEMSFEGNMNHAGMVPVLADASEVSPGRYEAPLAFTMSGDWFILVQATLPDGRTLEYQVDLPGVE